LPSPILYGVWHSKEGSEGGVGIKESKGPDKLRHVKFEWHIRERGKGGGVEGGGEREGEGVGEGKGERERDVEGEREGEGEMVELEVEVRVDGFGWVTPETGVLGSNGYLVLLRGHSRVATAFQPLARARVLLPRKGGRAVMMTVCVCV